jgi:solute carrier family 25 ornithine transporter 2/15
MAGDASPAAAAGLRLRDTLSGAFGSVCLTAAGLPFDRVKLLLQTHEAGAAGYRTPVDALRSVVARDGVLSLWRGAGPALASSMLENAVVFTANGFLRRFFAPGGDEASLSLGAHAALGGLSGVFSATAICAPEVVKCRMQHQEGALRAAVKAAGGGAAAVAAPRFANGFECARYVVATEGAAGLFAGLGPLLLRDVPFNTLFFGSYRTYMYLFSLLPPTPAMGAAAAGRGGGGGGGGGGGVAEAPAPSAPSGPGAASFLAGGFAGMTAWTVVFPFDVLKSRMQVGGAGGHGGMLALGRRVLAAGGWRGVYRGWSAAVMRAFPANAALFWGVDTADALLRQAGLE